MSRLHPKNRSPWTTIPVGTRVRLVAPSAMEGTVVTMRRKKFHLRYVVRFDGGEFLPERLMEMKFPRAALTVVGG